MSTAALWRSPLLPLFSIGLAAFLGSAVAQVRWIPRNIAGPPARYGAAMAYDASRGVLVLFGGRTQTTLFDDTWEFDGRRWRQVLTTVHPPAMSGAAMAFSARSGLVLFGGSDGRAYDRTWIYAGGSWRQVFPATVPPARERHAMASWGSLLRFRCVLFGGLGNRTGGAPSILNDTWEWNGNDWTRIAQTGPAPSPRFDAAMAFDPISNAALLFGGDGTVVPPAETWRLDANGWQQLSPRNSPSARDGAGLAFDMARDRWVLFGGKTATTLLDDVWEWDGVDWLQRQPSPWPSLPAPRARAAWAYHEGEAELSLFGGRGSTSATLGDHLVYGPIAPAFANEIGTGCTNSTGLASRLYMGLPWRGEPVDISLTNVPPPGLTLVGIGGTSSAWLGRNLPFDGGPFGMPGCVVYMAPAMTVAFPLTSTGRGTLSTWSVPVPPPASGVFRLQAFIVDPAIGNLAGAALSNAVAFAPGDK